jgi:hypothetical protein
LRLDTIEMRSKRGNSSERGSGKPNSIKSRSFKPQVIIQKKFEEDYNIALDSIEKARQKLKSAKKDSEQS